MSDADQPSDSSDDSGKTTISKGESSSRKGHLEKVSIKLPAFWNERPEVWFAQVEAQFEIAGINKELTKFNYLLANLEPNVVENIWDLVSEKKKEKYTLAKERLLSIFKTSEDKKIKNLISELELGDLKPSQLLRKMRGLAGDNFSDKILKTLWLGKLPNYLQNILVISDEQVDKLSEIADRIRDTKQLDEVQVKSEPGRESRSQQHLSEIQQLCDRIAVLESRLHQGNNSRFQRRNRSRSRSKPRFRENGDFCYYHFRFGDKCLPEKCKPPCKYNSGKESRQQ